ncbi:hypothetical protein GCM10023192_79180 [Amycolatopsis samaneae]
MPLPETPVRTIGPRSGRAARGRNTPGDLRIPDVVTVMNALSPTLPSVKISSRCAGKSGRQQFEPLPKDPEDTRGRFPTAPPGAGRE